MPPATVEELVRRMENLEKAAQEWRNLNDMMYGDPKRTIQGVLPALQELQVEVIKLRSAVGYLRLVTAMLAVMMLFMLLAVGYLVQVLA